MMAAKENLEHRICRQAILWERAGEDKADDAAEELREAVRDYMAFLIESSLPVDRQREPEAQASDPGVVIRR
jgi:hypothetical protein